MPAALSFLFTPAETAEGFRANYTTSDGVIERSGPLKLCMVGRGIQKEVRDLTKWGRSVIVGGPLTQMSNTNLVAVLQAFRRYEECRGSRIADLAKEIECNLLLASRITPAGELELSDYEREDVIAETTELYKTEERNFAEALAAYRRTFEKTQLTAFFARRKPVLV